MKWLLFAIALGGVLPLSDWLRRNPKQGPKIWALMGSLPFLLTALPRLEIALVSWPAWPGMARGIEISALDVLTLALYISLPRTRHPLPFKVSMLLYFSTVLLSAFQAVIPFAVFFYAWQLARAFLVYATVVRACADERVIPALLKGMAIGLCFEASMVVWQRVALGAIQASGTFGHQNLLGLGSHFVVYPFFALLLAGERGWWPIITPLAGATIAALTASRATVGLIGVGLSILFVLSAARKWTAQKARVALLGVAALGLLTPLALASFDKRFAAAPLAENYDERAALISASAMMVADRPLGVGANNFTLVNNVQGYADRANITWMSRSAIVHNIYWVTLAENGYIGLITLMILLLRPLTVSFRCGWRNRGDKRGDLMIGFAIALLITYVHSYFEWVFLTTQIQYLFAMTVGMIGGLAQEMGYWRRAKIFTSSPTQQAIPAMSK